MTLKYQIESIEGLDEAVAGLYEQGDNGYTLKVEGVVPKSQFDEINQKAVDNATEAKRRRGTVQRVLDKLGIEDAGALDETLDQLLTGKGKKDDDREAVIAQLKTGYEKQIQELQGALKSGAMDRAREAMKAEILQAGFHPEIAADIAASAMARVSIDESGKPVIMTDNGTPLAGSGADGHASFADYATKLAAEKPSFLVNAGKGGAASAPAGGNAKTSQAITRTQFDGMSQSERASFVKQGGKVSDG